MVCPEPTTPAWDDALLKDPHATADKRGRVRRMFAAIAPSYDLNNRLHSLGMDQRWRRRAVRIAELQSTDIVVDVACGTGDLAWKFADRLIGMGLNEAQWPGRVRGIDFTYEMLSIAHRKWLRGPIVYEYDHMPDVRDRAARMIQWITGDAQALPLPNASADVVSIAFGIRNVADPLAAFREFRRVLRPGGRLVVLEFSLPTNRALRWLYNLYFRKILPRTATFVSGDRTGAYKYLPESVNTFIGREQMMDLMRRAGFHDVEQTAMTFGVCVCYRGVT